LINTACISRRAGLSIIVIVFSLLISWCDIVIPEAALYVK
jgi:hypothetical protein